MAASPLSLHERFAIVDQVNSLIREGYTIVDAAARVGVSVACVYTYRNLAAQHGREVVPANKRTGAKPTASGSSWRMLERAWIAGKLRRDHPYNRPALFRAAGIPERSQEVFFIQLDLAIHRCALLLREMPDGKRYTCHDRFAA